MKKRYAVILIVLAFVVGMLSSGGYFAGADQSISVWINGEPLYTSPGPREIDGRVFVPLRAVSDSLGASVGWDDATNTVYIASQRDALTDIEIIGDASFQKEMRDALELLKDKDPEDYRFVGQYIRKVTMDSSIKSAFTSGYDMDIRVSTDYGKVGPVWWSAGLTHEAIHIKNIYNAAILTTEEQEIEANKKEVQVLQKLNAPQWMIDHSKNAISTKWWEQSPFK